MSADPSKKRELWERLDKGRKEKAAKGGYAGYGSPAFGQISENGELVENPQEQEIIELIRHLHRAGNSLQKIADWLNENQYRTKRGCEWKRISVQRVLKRLYGDDKPPSDPRPTETEDEGGLE